MLKSPEHEFKITSKAEIEHILNQMLYQLKSIDKKLSMLTKSNDNLIKLNKQF